MRHALAAVEPAILLGRPGFLITPCLEVGLAVVGQEHPPGRFKVGARLVERLRRAASAFSRPAIGIEPAVRLVSCGLPVRSAIVPTCTSP